MEFLTGKSEAYNKGWESFFIDREIHDNPHCSGTEPHKDWALGFILACHSVALKNRVTVKSIQEARELLAEVITPTLFVFPSLSFGYDDIEQLRALSAEAMLKKVVLQYDEADFLQNKAARLQFSVSASKRGTND